MNRNTALVFAGYLLFSVFWSWPNAALSPDFLVTRHFDLYPTIWAIRVAPDAFWG